MKIMLAIAVTFLLLVACMPDRSSHHSSSVVQYLYPDKTDPIESERIPRLNLPLRVGIAFVPESQTVVSSISEERKMHLMQTVKEHFLKYEFVKQIEVIPSAYLQAHGGFANVDQLDPSRKVKTRHYSVEKSMEKC